MTAQTPIHVYSEIGKLKKVLLHRPGKEIENLMPDYLERLLFDDIPFLEDAQKEHDAFAQALREDRKSTRLELQSRQYLVCRLLLEKKKNNNEYDKHRKTRDNCI